MTRDNLIEALKNIGIIHNLNDIMTEVDKYSESLTAAKPNVSGSLPPIVADEEISKQSILQGSQENHGCQAISQVYFRKGAKWMRELIGGNDR